MAPQAIEIAQNEIANGARRLAVEGNHNRAGEIPYDCAKQNRVNPFCCFWAETEEARKWRKRAAK
jgi:hypothetical protein